MSRLPRTFEQRKLWKTEVLKSQEDLGAALQAWKEIFVDSDPCKVPFTGQIAQHTVFYPTNRCFLTESQYEAVIQAAKNAGDRGFILAVSDWRQQPKNRQKIWWCAFPSYKQYLKLLAVPCEHVLYSVQGSWGILTSDTNHALVGGDTHFIKAIQQAYPAWQQELTALRSTWKGQLGASWIHRISPLNRMPATES